jgi:hypothetical protein
MARLVYSAITSLDGFVADRDGRFGWSTPDEAVHQRVNELHRGVGTYLYGRRLYDVMVAWETMASAQGSRRTKPGLTDGARFALRNAEDQEPVPKC